MGVLLLLCCIGCTSQSLRRDPNFTAAVLERGRLSLGGISALGGGPRPEEKLYEAEILRGFSTYWTNLTVLPIEAVDDCAGFGARSALLKHFSEGNPISFEDLLPFRNCEDRGRFLLLLNLETMDEKYSGSSREETSLAGAETTYLTEARARLRVAAAIYDSKTGRLVWEGRARSNSTNQEVSQVPPQTWPATPQFLKPFRGALFQLEARLSRDTGGPAFPWVKIEIEH